MKVAFTTSGEALDAPLDERFGRAPKFLIYDLDENSFEIIDNKQNVDAPQGAGVQAARTIAQSGAASLVTGHCGPKAFEVLSVAGIEVYNTNEPTVAAALEAFKGGKLQAAKSADVGGHWS